MFCYLCGTKLPENARFCPGCGIALNEDTEPIPQESVEEPEEIVADEAVPVAEPDAAPLAEAHEVPEMAAEPVSDVAADAVIPELKPVKKRPLLVPSIIMSAMLVIGTVLFFLLPDPVAERPSPTNPGVNAPSETSPSQQPGSTTKPPLPSGGHSDAYKVTETDCFRMTEDGLVFLPELHSGAHVLVIPSELDGQAVTAIAPGGFAGYDDITTLVLPESLVSIGESAFEDCTGLRGIWLPDSVRQVGENAFRGCIGLESVAVNGGIEAIGPGAFTGCARLLYFFYDGTHDQWLKLYNEYVTPFTSVTCLDGDYYHGVEMP